MTVGCGDWLWQGTSAKGGGGGGGLVAWASPDLVAMDKSDALADEDVAKQWEQPEESREGALLVEGDPVNVVDLRTQTPSDITTSLLPLLLPGP